MEDDTTKKRTLTTPLKAKMVVLIILGAVIAETPRIAYQSLREILKPYAKGYALTDSIMQEGRAVAKDVLFGSA